MLISSVVYLDTACIVFQPLNVKRPYEQVGFFRMGWWKLKVCCCALRDKTETKKTFAWRITYTCMLTREAISKFERLTTSAKLKATDVVKSRSEKFQEKRFESTHRFPELIPHMTLRQLFKVLNKRKHINLLYRGHCGLLWQNLSLSILV